MDGPNALARCAKMRDKLRYEQQGSHTKGGIIFRLGGGFALCLRRAVLDRPLRRSPWRLAFAEFRTRYTAAQLWDRDPVFYGGGHMGLCCACAITADDGIWPCGIHDPRIGGVFPWIWPNPSGFANPDHGLLGAFAP